MARENEQFQVLRVIGNNVVMVQGGKKSKEYVIIGKGIGFALKDAGVIDADDPRIEKLFRLEDREEWSQYQILLEDIDPKVMRITDEIISDIAREFPGKLNDKIYLALPSHIQFTIFRLRSGMDIVNPFLEETRMTFPRNLRSLTRQRRRSAWNSRCGFLKMKSDSSPITYILRSAMCRLASWSKPLTSSVI